MLKERLVKLRTYEGLSQYELAKVLNLSRGQISNYELGTRQPDYETLAKIADYFNVTTDYLLGRIDDPTPINKEIKAPVWLTKFINLIKDERGAIPTDVIPVLFAELAKLYAVSQGVPLSLITSQMSQVPDLSDEEKAQLINEIDIISQEDTNSTTVLAKEIENLPEKERAAMEAMLEVLKSRSNDAAAQGS